MTDQRTSTTTSPSTPTTGGTRPALLRWRTIDLVTVAMLGVAIGLAFWGWSQLYHVISAATALAFPPIAGLLSGPWLLGGVVGALVVRKPGAAIGTEVVAASVEALLGNGWGVSNLLIGAIQAFGVEVVLAILLWRRFGLLAALASGAASAVCNAIYSWVVYYSDWSVGAFATYVVLVIISGVLAAGLLGWVLVRALARTGVLDAFPVGRDASRRRTS